jgi:lipopolysaccharide transport system permease protein
MTSKAEALVTDIQPTSGWAPVRLGDLWEYRELLYFLVWRDLKVRYRQTVLGASWAVLQPFMTMAVFTLFFGIVAGLPSDGLPYPLFAYTALVPWTFFAQGVALSSNSLVANQALIRKVYFPRLVIPIATVASIVVDFAIAFAALLVMMAFYGLPIPLQAVWLPAFVVLAIAATIGVGLWLSALNVLYRDVQHVVPFLVQTWLFATPIVYPSSLIPEPWHTVYGLNPMAGVVDGFRWALLGSGTAPGPMLLVSMLSALTLLVTSFFVFRRIERLFADVV